MIDLSIFLQATPEGIANSNMIQMALWVAIIAVLYFLILRPGTKRAKQEKAFHDSIQNGDKVVTKSGIHGKIVKASEGTSTVILQVADNVKLKVERSALSSEMSTTSDGADA